MAELREGILIQDRYELKTCLGSGGFGSVWLVRDNDLKRDVAIKRLHARSRFDPSIRDEVVAEARKIASLSDPHIVSVFDVLTHEDELLIIMEYLPGGTLHDYLRDLSFAGRWVEVPEALKLLKEILLGLKAAHACDDGPIIHRDLKPLNILFNRARQAKIADFGLAATGMVDAIKTAHPGKWEHEGTFGYKSPEQLNGAQIDLRSDLFNVGLIGYLLLAAAHPFTDPRFLFDYKEMVLKPYRNLPRVDFGELSDELAEFIAILLAVDPDQRFQSAFECLSELEHIEEKYNAALLNRVVDLYDNLKTGASSPSFIGEHELARGIALCKKSGFYIQGAFLYENSGIDFGRLHAEDRQALETNYFFCRRRAGREVTPE